MARFTRTVRLLTLGIVVAGCGSDPTTESAQDAAPDGRDDTSVPDASAPDASAPEANDASEAADPGPDADDAADPGPDAGLNCTPGAPPLRGHATFHSIGLELTAPEGEARVTYRPVGGAWRSALPLWYDARDGGEHRGSLVHLAPGTVYDVQVALDSTVSCGTFQTMAEDFPIGQTTDLGSKAGQVDVTTSGSVTGYHLVVGGTITGGRFNLYVDAEYVIIRGLMLRDAQENGIELGPKAKHVVIERNEITGWGRKKSDEVRPGSPAPIIDDTNDMWGENLDSGIHSREKGVSHIVIQGNYIHSPRTDANAWNEYRPTVSGGDSANCYNAFPGSGVTPRCHPQGPQGISFRYSSGHNIIRYNTIAGTPDRMFNDTMGGFANFSTEYGFPGSNSDVYGNDVTGFMDDGLELEGDHKNVRVWNNRIYAIGSADQAANTAVAGLALSATHWGPLYAWRNVLEYERDAGVAISQAVKAQSQPLDSTTPTTGGGRVYFLHNTFTGPGGGYRSSGSMLHNVWARNNIMAVKWTDFEEGGVNNSFDYNLSTDPLPGQPHTIEGAPTFATGVQLAPTSLGVDDGLCIPDFNDCSGAEHPDRGALEVGSELRVGHTHFSSGSAP
jgi:hypothetical protein